WNRGRLGLADHFLSPASGGGPGPVPELGAWFSVGLALCAEVERDAPGLASGRVRLAAGLAAAWTTGGGGRPVPLVLGGKIGGHRAKADPADVTNWALLGPERVRLRRAALSWLSAELAIAKGRALEGPAMRAAIARALRPWLTAQALGPVRDAGWLARLPQS